MKKIDRLLIRAFIPPFVITFHIAIFVLLMQALWLYIDDIVGKGASLFFIIEMIFYMSVSLAPMAFPIAVLISSVMVMGNLAERYELATLKSAGVSLLRIMRPLMVLTLLITALSYLCSNYMIPIANLKFSSRLYDMKKQKPMLTLEEGVFNYDFEDYVIYIKDKGRDGRTIKDVLIYDRENGQQGLVSQIVANEGEMYTTEDDRYLVMNLEEGVQYQELDQRGKGRRRGDYPLMRTYFQEWNKTYDLSEFYVNWTDPGLFKTHHRMLSVGQLQDAIDTLALQLQNRREGLYDFNMRYLPNYWKNSKPLKTESDSLRYDSIQKRRDILRDSAPPPSEEHLEASGHTPPYRPPSRLEGDLAATDTLQLVSFLQGYTWEELSRFCDQAATSARNILSQGESVERMVKRLYERRVKHIFEMHFKFTMAVVCFIFLFVGAPMGAIVRKGGFGFPILIAIMFFMLFMIMNITFKNMAEKAVMTAELGAWLPLFILFPIGLSLTYKAMNDSKILNFDRYLAFFRKLRRSKDKVQQREPDTQT